MDGYSYVTIQLSLNGTHEIGIGIPISCEASISCRMAFPQAETLILRPEIDRGSNILLLLGDVHAAACGLQSGEFPRHPPLRKLLGLFQLGEW